MATDPELEAAVSAITMRLAFELVDSLDLAAMLGSEEEIGERLIRRMRRAAMLEQVAELVWTEHASEMLLSTLSEAGLPESAIDAESLERTFRVFFVTAARGKLDEGSEILERLEFEQSGGAGVAGPSNGTGDITNYVLARDDDGVVYISGEGADDFGVSWRLGASGWEADNRIPLTLSDSRVQPFTGFYDPVRKGIACWTLVSAGIEKSVARGVLVDASGANPIEQSGDVPTGPFSCHFDFGVIFGRDPERDVTVAVGREVVWELDASAEWRKVAEIPEAIQPHKTWFGGTSGSVFAPGHGVVFYWKDWDDSDLFMLSWNGQDIASASTDGLDYRMYTRDAASFCEHPDDGAVLLMTAGTEAGLALAFAGTRWKHSDRLEGDLPGMENATAAYDDGCWIIGPGKRQSDSGSSVDEQALYTIDGTTVTRTGDTRVGTGSASAGRLLAAGPTARVVHQDGRVAVRDESGWADCGSLDADIVALVPGGDDSTFFAIARDGAVHARRGDEWTQLGWFKYGFDAVRGVVFCYDSAANRLVGWGGRKGADASDDTIVFDLDAGPWKKLQEVGSALSKKSTRRRNSDEERDLGCHLVFDTALGQTLLFHRDEVAALQNDRWAVVSAANFDRLVEDDHRLVLHDPSTKETLIVCLTKDRVIRFDVGQCTLVCDTSAPSGADLGRARLDRPWQADWAYEANAGRLVLFYDDDLDATLSLDVGAAFVHAANKGDRTPLAVSQAYRLDSEPDVVAAITAAAVNTASILSDEQIEGALSLPLRMCTDNMIRDGAVRMWRAVGPDAVQAACGEAGIDLAARGFSAEDCREMFADVLAATLGERG